MPYADHAGVRIYYEVLGNAAGPPLLLHHGFTADRREWHDFGYGAALGPDYRLLLLDARGHGASDKPHDPAAYDMARRAGDVLAVLDAVGVEQAESAVKVRRHPLQRKRWRPARACPCRMAVA